MEVLIYIGKAAIVLSLFYFVYAALLKSDTHFASNRLFLVSGLIVSCIVPIIQFTKTVTLPAPTSDLITYSENLAYQTATVPQQFDWWYLAGILYFLVAGVFFIRFLKQLFTLLLLLKRHPVQIENGFKYIITNEKVLPFSFFNYIAYNPSLHNAAELSMILKHEEVHAYQKHSIDILLANLFTTIQWANPIAWLYKKSIEENLEFIADNEAVVSVSSKKDYQIALVKASSASTIPALTTNFYQSFIKKRIVMLNKHSSNKRNTIKAVAIVPLLAVFLWSFNIHEKIEYATPTNEKPQQKSVATNLPDEKLPIAVATSNSIVNVSKEESQNSAIGKPTAEKQITQQDSVKGFQIIITKNTTVEELEAYKTMLKKEHNATFNYSNLNFNSKGEITSIAISYSDKRGNNNNYSVSSGSPISDFMLSVSENGAISSRTILTEEQKAEREKMMEQRDEMISERNEEMEMLKERRDERREEMKAMHKERREHMKERKEVMKERIKMVRARSGDSATVIIRVDTLHYNNPKKIYSNNASATEGPVIFIDGKETSEKALKLVSPEQIKKINVLKGKKAIKKYGIKAAKGVLEITTKN